MRIKRALLAVLCAVAALSVTLPTITLADDSNSNGSKDNKYYYDKVVNTGLDNGYSESNSIKEGDPPLRMEARQVRRQRLHEQSGRRCSCVS